MEKKSMKKTAEDFDPKKVVRIAYDTELMRPGCPLLQAAMGGNPEVVSFHFDPRTWLVEPTLKMKLYGIEEHQLAKLAEVSVAVRSEGEGEIKRRAG
jgi:hypothetical protein